MQSDFQYNVFWIFACMIWFYQVEGKPWKKWLGTLSVLLFAAVITLGEAWVAKHFISQ